MGIRVDFFAPEGCGEAEWDRSNQGTRVRSKGTIHASMLGNDLVCDRGRAGDG